MNRYFAIGAYAVLAGMTGLSPAAAGTWPKHTVTDAQRQVGIAEAKLYRDQKNDAAPRSQEYRPDGDYLNYGKTTFHRPSDKLKLDADGLPTMLQAGAFQYNPGTIANFALAEHGRKSDKFLVAAEKLRSMQGADGALRYDYTYRHYTVTHAYAPGWISGMDQGLALSVYARAYLATKDRAWIDAGDQALAFLEVPFPDGPMTNLSDLDPSLADYIFFEEYLVDPNVYTLNGYMFTLLGFYDWWKVAGSEKAGDLFAEGIVSLEKLLPYYDIGTFSTYDLGYITHGKPYLMPIKPHVAARYHAFHIAQLRALYSVTGNVTLKNYAEKWQGYVQ